MENRGGEDIRSKLARYKKEREDFEIIRQQFRQKNSEIASSNNVSTSQGTGFDHTPAAGVSANLSGSNKFSASGGAAKGNIFSVDHHSSTNQVKAFSTSTHMTSGSPAFGLAE